MKNSVRLSFQLILAIGLLSGCSGGRKKQSVSVQPAPGSAQPATDTKEGDTSQPAVVPVTEEEQNNPGTGEQTDTTLDDQGQGGSTTPGTNGSNGTTTDLTIETTLDNSTVSNSTINNGVVSEVPWDGRTFKGSGKWKVEPMP